MYFDQLTHLHKYFDKKQIFITTQDDLKTDTQNVLNKIFNFLNINHFNIDINKQRNKNKYDEKPSQKNLQQLYQIYKEPNQKLFNFLGYEINSWIKNHPD